MSWPVAVALGIGACGGSLTALLFGLSLITSESMSPTLKPKQHVLTVRASPLFSMWPSLLTPTLLRGDLVVLQGPQADRLLLKRIVALSGDRVHIKEGLLFLNGLPVYEPYAHHGSPRLREMDEWPTGPVGSEIAVPTRMVFVLGDNRSESTDSRLWGAVPVSDVVAKVVLRLP